MSYYEQAMKNMTPEMMKQMGDMYDKMSDDQIRQHAQMAGMGNIDPNFLRTQMRMMKNMKNEDLQQKVNQTRPEDIENAKRMASQYYQQPQQPQQTQNNELYPTIAKLKNQGNEAFNKQDYEKAASKYYEAISEIEEMWENNSYLKTDKTKEQELKKLEHTCRLNYCNVKSKQQQFDVVRRQAQKVLDDDASNGKANYRMGQALYETKRVGESIEFLEKATQQLPNDDAVKQLLRQAKEQQNQKKDTGQKQNFNTAPQPAKQEEKKQEEQIKQEQKQEVKEVQKEQKQEVQQEEKQEVKQPQKEQQQPNNEEDQAPKKPKIKLSSVDTNSAEFKNKPKQQKEEGIIMEETPVSKPSPPPQQPPPQQPQINKQPNVNDPQFQQQFEQFKNMSPDQMAQMSNTMKNMDKNFLKSMMKQQHGVEMSDQQIEMMKNMMTPEMMQQMKNIDPSLIQQQQQQKQREQQQSQQQQPTQGQQQSQQPSQQSQPSQPSQPQQPQQQQMPSNLQGFAQNPQMISMVIDQLKANPQMLKMMAPMFGQNNKISNYIESASPEQLQVVVGRLALLLKFLLTVYRAWLYIKEQWKFILGFLLAYLYFKLF